MKKHLSILLAISCFACASPQEKMQAAELALADGRFEKALSIYEDLVEEAKSKEEKKEDLKTLANLYLLTNQNEKALQAYRQLVAFAPLQESSRIFYEHQLSLLEKMGKTEELLEMLTSLVKYYPQTPRVHYYKLKLAEAYLVRGNYQEARSVLNALLQQNDLLADVQEKAVFDLAETYYLEGEKSDAVNAYSFFLKHFPDSSLDAEVRLKMASLAESMGFLGPATQITNELENKYPNKEALKVRIDKMKKNAK